MVIYVLMEAELLSISNTNTKESLPSLKSGDTVKVSQQITEGNKTRVQVFEGLVIRRRRYNSPSANITVRKTSGGIGVEKMWFMHSPSIVKVEVVKRGKARRNFLSYMRERQGKSTKLKDLKVDVTKLNVKEVSPAVKEVKASSEEE